MVVSGKGQGLALDGCSGIRKMARDWGFLEEGCQGAVRGNQEGCVRQGSGMEGHLGIQRGI